MFASSSLWNYSAVFFTAAIWVSFSLIIMNHLKPSLLLPSATTTITKSASMKQSPPAPFDPSPERLSFFSPPMDPCHVNETSPIVLVPDHHESFAVLQRVRRGVSRAQERRNRTLSNTRRILCMVYTYEPNHATLLRSIVSTWGRQCDGFYAASNATDRALGAYNLPKQGPESYANMWQKTRQMWKLAYDFFLDDYDYFLICGDDTYVVMENFRDYLDSDKVKRLELGYRDVFAERADPQGKWRNVVDRPLILAQPVALNIRKDRTFPVGGPGYILNRAAVELFGREGYATHFPNATDSREDVFMGDFFYQQGIATADTRDENGARYFAGNAPMIYQLGGFKDPMHTSLMKKKFNITFPKRDESISEGLVAFHMKDLNKNPVVSKEIMAQSLYRYHAVLHGQCLTYDSNGLIKE